MTERARPPMPAADLMQVLLPAFSPCPSFSQDCRDYARWDPACGHIPRGWIGAPEHARDVRLVLVTAEPGDPADGEIYHRLDAQQSAERYHRTAYAALVADSMRRGGRPTPFHVSLRRILDECWPALPIEEQMRRTWVTPAVLCSATPSGNDVPRAAETACGTRYLVRQLELLNDAFVAALGGKASKRLRQLGTIPHAEAQHPSARPNTNPTRSWVELGAAFRAWLAERE